VNDPSATPGDLLQLVDEDDNDVGTAPRSQVHSLGWKHRSVHVAVTDGKGRLLLQKRSRFKDTSPGLWDISVGGHLDAGEGYLTAALRECSEEIGVRVTSEDLHSLGRHWFLESPTDQERVETFVLCHPGPFTPNPGEVDEVRFLDASQIEAWIAAGQTTVSFALQWSHHLRSWLVK
jgi:isopentenyldiphosphate isomerase